MMITRCRGFVLLLLLSSLLLPSWEASDSSITTKQACFTVNEQPVEPGTLVRCFAERNDYVWMVHHHDGTDARTDADGCIAVRDHRRLGRGDKDMYCRITAGDCFATTTTRLPTVGAAANATASTMVYEYDDDYYYSTRTSIELPWDSRYCGERAGNGCGPAWFPRWLRFVLDGVSGMEDECRVHDACYERCGTTRSECDARFLQDMRRTCDGRHGACRVLANVFHAAVSRFGHRACHEARRTRCGSVDECLL